MNKLLDIYKSILAYLRLEADNNGNIFISLNDGKKESVAISGSKLVLPTEYQLKSGSTEIAIFHPLMEHIMQQESPVLNKIKNIININLNYTFGMLFSSLLNLLATPEYHSKLNKDQLDLLTRISDIDEKCLTNFTQYMLKEMQARPANLFINLFIKRGGVVNGKKFTRAGIVVFPFYDELNNGKLGKFRVKDKEIYLALIKYIFPNIDDEEQFNYGSDSNVAPSLHSLLMTSANIASQLNDVINLFSQFIEDHDKLLFSSDWLTYFDELENLMPEIRKVPLQTNSVSNDNNMQQTMQPVLLPQLPGPYPNQYPQQYPYSAPQIPQQPPIRKTSNGLSLRDALNSNPAIGYNSQMANPYFNNQNQHMQIPAQRTPSWAIENNQQGMFNNQQMMPQYPNMQLNGMMSQYPNMQPNGMMPQYPNSYPYQR